jgi:hypothetical protein
MEFEHCCFSLLELYKGVVAQRLEYRAEFRCHELRVGVPVAIGLKTTVKSD